MNQCKMCNYEKENKKINYARLVGYGLAFGIIIYAAYEQYFNNSNEKKDKIEQVGKSIEDKLK